MKKKALIGYVTKDADIGAFLASNEHVFFSVRIKINHSLNTYF